MVLDVIKKFTKCIKNLTVLVLESTSNCRKIIMPWHKYIKIICTQEDYNFYIAILVQNNDME